MRWCKRESGVSVRGGSGGDRSGGACGRGGVGGVLTPFFLYINLKYTKKVKSIKIRLNKDMSD